MPSPAEHVHPVSHSRLKTAHVLLSALLTAKRATIRGLAKSVSAGLT